MYPALLPGMSDATQILHYYDGKYNYSIIKNGVVQELRGTFFGLPIYSEAIVSVDSDVDSDATSEVYHDALPTPNDMIND